MVSGTPPTLQRFGATSSDRTSRKTLRVPNVNIATSFVF